MRTVAGREGSDDAGGQERDCTGNAFLCEDVLTAEGVTDFDRYAYQPGAEPQADLFVDHA